MGFSIDKSWQTNINHCHFFHCKLKLRSKLSCHEQLHTLVEQLVRGLLHVPRTGAQGHPDCPLLNAHIFQLPHHNIKLWVLVVRSCVRCGPVLCCCSKNCIIVLVLSCHHCVLWVIRFRSC